MLNNPLNRGYCFSREADITKEKIEKILASGATVVLTTGGIDDLCLKYFVEVGVMAVRRCKKEDLKRIARATGGEHVVMRKFVTLLDKICKMVLLKAFLLMLTSSYAWDSFVLMVAFVNPQVRQCWFHCLICTPFNFEICSLLLLFECGGVSGRPVIKNHAPLWKQPLLWLNVDYHSINYEAYYTSHIACQPHSYLNPNQLMCISACLTISYPLCWPPPPPYSHSGNISSQPGGRWELWCFPIGLCRECHSRESVWWWTSLDQRVSGCFVWCIARPMIINHAPLWVTPPLWWGI